MEFLAPTKVVTNKAIRCTQSRAHLLERLQNDPVISRLTWVGGLEQAEQVGCDLYSLMCAALKNNNGLIILTTIIDHQLHFTIACRRRGVIIRYERLTWVCDAVTFTYGIYTKY